VLFRSHQSAPVNDAQRIAVDIFDIQRQDFSISSDVSDMLLPLHSKAELVWVGFDFDSLRLNIFDSHDLVSTLIYVGGWQWVPVLDIAIAKRSSEHRFWPVTVKGDRFSYVLLNGESKPSISPAPVVTVKDFKVPTLREKGKASLPIKGELSHQVLWNIAVINDVKHKRDEIERHNPSIDESEDMEKCLEGKLFDLDKSALKLLQEVCGTQQLAVAYDLIQRLHTDRSLQLAIKIANASKMPRIAEAADEILDKRREAAVMQVDEERDQEVYSTQPSHLNIESEYEGVETSVMSRNDALTSSSSFREHNAASSSGNSVNISSNFSMTSNSFEEAPIQSSAARVPVNPFAVKNTSPKRKSFLAGIQEMKGSPSPKKSLLSRQSSFSQQAKKKQNIGKVLM